MDPKRKQYEKPKSDSPEGSLRDNNVQGEISAESKKQPPAEQGSGIQNHKRSAGAETTEARSEQSEITNQDSQRQVTNAGDANTPFGQEEKEGV